MLEKIDKYGDIICEMFIMLVVLLVPGTMIWILYVMLPILGIAGLIVMLFLCVIEAIMIELELERIIEEVIKLKEAE